MLCCRFRRQPRADTRAVTSDHFVWRYAAPWAAPELRLNRLEIDLPDPRCALFCWLSYLGAKQLCGRRARGLRIPPPVQPDA
jgi:hypothetical protein